MQLFSYFVYIQKDCMHSDNWAVFCQLTQCLLIQLQLPILTQFSQRKGEKNWASVCLKPPPQNRVTITWIASEVISILISIKLNSE